MTFWLLFYAFSVAAAYFIGKDGWKIPTCCYGHTDAAGAPKYAATKDKKFTREEGLNILCMDLAKYEAAVRSKVTVPLTDNQFGALVSFTFNVGPANFNKSTLLRKLNAGDYKGAAAELPKWRHAAGRVLNGLIRRRAAEQALFNSQPSTDSKPVPAPERQSWLLMVLQVAWKAIVGLFNRKD